MRHNYYPDGSPLARAHALGHGLRQIEAAMEPEHTADLQLGVPPLVRLPTKRRQPITFRAHGKDWRVNRIGADTWTLSCPAHSPRMRFGTVAEIIDDIEHVLETGALPRSKHA